MFIMFVGTLVKINIFIQLVSHRNHGKYMRKHVKVGSKIVGDNWPVFIIVELGVTHEQNINLAKHFVEVAAKSGADAVKVEAFKAEELTMDKQMTHSYGTYNGIVSEIYYELGKRLELKADQIIEIKNKAKECNIQFFSTVHSNEDVDFFNELDVCAFKIGSGDITHLPLIKYISKNFDKPVFMDTGGAYLNEIDLSLRCFERYSFDKLILMHNPLGYPAPPKNTDLKIIPTLKNLYDIPVGLSCHTPGFDMVVASVAVGANAVEKPITRDNRIQGPEHCFSFLHNESDIFIEKIRKTEICLGKRRRSNINESAHARRVRRGIYLKHDLNKGHILTEEDFVYRIPNQGFGVNEYESLIGRELLLDCKKLESLTVHKLKV